MFKFHVMTTIYFDRCCRVKTLFTDIWIYFKAHSEACIVSEFAACLRGLNPAEVKPALTLLCTLHAVNGILQESGDFLGVSLPLWEICYASGIFTEYD